MKVKLVSAGTHIVSSNLFTVWHLTGLVDSVRHVLELLCSSTNEKTHAAEVIALVSDDYFECFCSISSS